MNQIPVSVLVCARNEEKRMASCLSALQDFSEIVVIDSGSNDNTAAKAESFGAQVIPFAWNGLYPKKRQWCLDHLDLAHDWIFFVDADEIVTPELVMEIRKLIIAPAHDGYFIDGLYVMGERMLKHGMKNSKLVLFDRRKFAFPVVDDLDLPGMGEMEGHYQPVPKGNAAVGRLKSFMLHYAYDSSEDWLSRHERYARWEAGMNARKAWPEDPVPLRQALKRFFRALPCRGVIAFLYSYIVKRGLLDGRAGFLLARDRCRYYALIERSRQ